MKDTLVDAALPAGLLEERLGEYRVVRALGAGGQAEVFEVVAPSGERRAAKLLHPELVDDARAVARFRREALAGSSVEHPGLLRVVAIETLEDGRVLVVSELLEGEDLATRLDRAGAMDAAEALRVAIGVAEALAALHAAGVVHRDLKPANLFVVDGGVKIIDFGLAKLTEGWDATRLTKSAAILGSPAFMSPEQIRSPAAVGPQTDVYALGATLYATVTAQLPYSAPNLVKLLELQLRAQVPDPRVLRPELPAAFTELVRHAMAKDPRERYADGAEWLAALRAVAAGRPAPLPASASAAAPPTPPPAPASEAAPKVPPSWIAAIFAALALFVWWLAR